MKQCGSYKRFRWCIVGFASAPYIVVNSCQGQLSCIVSVGKVVRMGDSQSSWNIIPSYTACVLIEADVILV